MIATEFFNNVSCNSNNNNSNDVLQIQETNTKMINLDRSNLMTFHTLLMEVVKTSILKGWSFMKFCIIEV
jgi:hypothetical protein